MKPKIYLPLIVIVILCGGIFFFNRGGDERVMACSEFFDDQNSEVRITAPFSCSWKQDAALFKLRVLVDQTVSIYRGDTRVFHLPYSEEAELHADLFSLFSDKQEVAADAFDFVDINYDGFSDLMIRTSAGAYNFSYTFFTYNPKTKAFDDKPLLAEMTNPAIDPNTKTVTSFSKGRGIGDIYTIETYTFGNGTYTLTRIESQDILDENGSTDKGYVHTVRALQGGKMVETERTLLSKEEIGIE